jgi:hypothetical protein
MTYLNKPFDVLSNAPSEPKIVDGDGKLTQTWQNWINDLKKHVFRSNSLKNDHNVLNPDFNHYGTTRSTDGEVCKPWQIKANGLTFTATPTAYTSTADNADTGSKQFINVDITAAAGQEFELFQKLTNQLSKYQKKSVTILAKVKNNGSFRLPIYFYIGVDTNNDGNDDFNSTSGRFFIEDNGIANTVTATFKVPEIAADNQNNKVTVRVSVGPISSPINFDILYVKDEFSDKPTVLQVDHTLEKIRIDNAP